METVVIVTGSRDPAYLRIWEHVARGEVARGKRVVILDAASAAAAPVDNYHRGALRMLRLHYPGHDARERFGEFGATVRDISDFVGGDDPHLGDAHLDEAAEAELDVAVGSMMATYFRNDRPDRRRRRVRNLEKALQREGRRVYRGLTAAIEQLDVGLVYVPNGRAPGQRLAALATRRSGAQLLHLEKGESPDSAFLRPYSPHDRLASQDSIAEVLAGHDRAEITAVAEEWMARRAPAPGSSNQFSALWDASSSVGFPRDATVVGFFTSSQDEFQSLGPDWRQHEWAGQYRAFDEVMTYLEEHGIVCYLRVHPNLATKAHAYFLRERAEVKALAAKHPNLRIIQHDDPVNTYDLLEASDGVVVWTSTVGLEASARGLPVWTLASTRYGLTADITEVFSVADLPSEPFAAVPVDRQGALDFIAYLVLRDEPLSTEEQRWLPWDAARPPRGSRIAAVLASGGAPYARDAIASVFDSYRHRRLKANLRHIAHR